MRSILLILTFSALAACTANRSFWRYVVEEPVEKPLAGREQGTADNTKQLSPHNVKVVYNDGSRSTEVLIPMLSSGQQVVIDHQGRAAGKSLALVPVPPTPADKEIEEAYLEGGNKLSPKSAPVSIIETDRKIREHDASGNYSLALQFADQLLARYPNHVKTLRAKGSLLLKLGERQAALRAYNQAEDIEPNPRVQEQIKAIEDSMNKESVH